MTDLSKILEEQSEHIPSQEELDTDMLEVIAQSLVRLDSLANTVAVDMAALHTRLIQLEKHVGYLITKDPVMGPKILAQANSFAADLEKEKENGPSSEK